MTTTTDFVTDELNLSDLFPDSVVVPIISSPGTILKPEEIPELIQEEPGEISEINIEPLPAPEETPPTPTTTNAAQRALANLAYVLVPYRWSRIVSNSGHSVYYITPSGRVLLSIAETMQYLTSEQYCKCYLDPMLTFEEVFFFDPTVGSLQLPEIIEDDQHQYPKWKCAHWISSVPELDMVTRVKATRRYLEAQSIVSSEDIFKVRAAAGLVPAINDDFNVWLNSADWNDFIVLANGHTFARQLTNDHLKHLVFEFALNGTNLNSYMEQLLMESANEAINVENNTEDDILQDGLAQESGNDQTNSEVSDNDSHKIEIPHNNISFSTLSINLNCFYFSFRRLSQVLKMPNYINLHHSN